MKMNMKKLYSTALFSALAGSVLFGAQPASAQDVVIVGPPCIFNVLSSTEEDAEVTEKEVESFRIYAQAGEDLMQIATPDAEEGEEEYIRKDELAGLLPDLELDKFPKKEEVKTFSQGANSEDVKFLQETLADLKFLDGEIDGAYGGGTAEAVRKFQESVGLETTGQAGIYTMMLITAIHDGMEQEIEVSSKEFTSPEEKFPQIADQTDDDLMPFLNGRWRFRYDEFNESGEIDPGIALGEFADESRDIDRISGTLSIKVLVNKSAETGRFVLVPGIVVKTEGAYRPYLQGAILVGDRTVRLEDGSSTGSVNGISMLETGCVPLTKDAMDLLAGGSVTAIRLLGKNTEYDVQVQADMEKTPDFMEACMTLAE